MRWKLFLWVIAVHSVFGQTPSKALQRLVDGNGRYTTDELLYADHSADRRNSLLLGQSPFATIVSCSDSRVTPEVIFDQGVGDLFIVRIAGNVAGPIELDSIDFSVKKLGSSLILVLGHESCGAVKAVLNKEAGGIQHIAALIEPAVQHASDLEMAIKDNVRSVVATLKQHPLFKQSIKQKKLACMGAYYSLATGHVEILH